MCRQGRYQIQDSGYPLPNGVRGYPMNVNCKISFYKQSGSKHNRISEFNGAGWKAHRLFFVLFLVLFTTFKICFINKIYYKDQILLNIWEKSYERHMELFITSVLASKTSSTIKGGEIKVPRQVLTRRKNARTFIWEILSITNSSTFWKAATVAEQRADCGGKNKHFSQDRFTHPSH